MQNKQQNRSVAREYLLEAWGALIFGVIAFIFITIFSHNDWGTLILWWLCIACTVVVVLVLLFLSLFHAIRSSKGKSQRYTGSRKLEFYMFIITLLLIGTLIKLGIVPWIISI